MARKINSPRASRRPVRQTRQVSFPRRLNSFLLSPYVLAPLCLLFLITIGFFVYYYFRYTELIDAGLRGDIFVRSSGIYAAPPELRPGGQMKLATLVNHLKRIGYLERGTTQNEKRGRYAVRGSTVEIEPGSETVVDGSQVFRRLKVSFNRNSDGIQSLQELSTQKGLDRAEIEPEMISSVINPEREKRKIIDYKDLPQSLIDAIVVIEDRQFFEHLGINWRGILRAAIRDYQTGSLREGGSSITQQLVKNFYLKPEKTPKRKLAEAYISVLLEQRLSKEQIMAMYCNQIYLGQRGGFSINGFGQAARSYFDKDISHLTLAESALLAGIIRSPNYYNPFTHEDRAIERRNFVVEQIFNAGKVTREEADAAKRAPLGVKGKAGAADASDAPYFIDYLTKQLETQFDDHGTSLRSLRIFSTLDLSLQRAAYQAVTKHMANIEKMFAKRKGGTAGLQAALVALDPRTGDILAMVGGRDYAASQLNRATDARRQPGSVFKPFVYATALSQTTDEEAVITPATMFMDAPRSFENGLGKPYSPGNYGDQYDNKMLTLRDALVYSKNVITVELAERIGFREIARLAEKAGFPRIPTVPSMALGVGEATPLQVAAAYTTFPNQGRRISPVAIKRITLSMGTTVYRSEKETREVLSPQVAYLMTSMMQDVINRGTGSRVRQMGFKSVAAGKTGSSRDGWFAGYSPNLVCIVWVGFDDNRDLGLTGGVAAAPIWGEFMMRALELRPDLGGDFTNPGDILTVDIDPETGQLAQSNSEHIRHELFIRGTEPNNKMPDTSVDQPDTPPATDPPPQPQKPVTAQPGATSAGRPSIAAASAVTLEVCALSGLLPGSTCPKIQSRTFPLGREPHVSCRPDFHSGRARVVK
jgi:penicillin-binding protein 1B